MLADFILTIRKTTSCCCKVRVPSSLLVPFVLQTYKGRQ